MQHPPPSSKNYDSNPRANVGRTAARKPKEEKKTLSKVAMIAISLLIGFMASSVFQFISSRRQDEQRRNERETQKQIREHFTEEQLAELREMSESGATQEEIQAKLQQWAFESALAEAQEKEEDVVDMDAIPADVEVEDVVDTE